MRLTIYNVQRYDYGTYKCVAKNPRGETDGTIRLYCKLFLLQHFIRQRYVSAYTSTAIFRFRLANISLVLCKPKKKKID